MLVSGVLALLGIHWIARAFVVGGQLRFGNPVEETFGREDPSGSQGTLQVRAEVTLATGESGVVPGDRCEFLVERRARHEDGFYCNAQVVCGKKLLYGGPDRGYFPCKIFERPRRGVMGTDPLTTSADQDAAIHLDTRSGVLRLWDDARGVHGVFSIEADVLSVN